MSFLKKPVVLTIASRLAPEIKKYRSREVNNLQIAYGINNHSVYLDNQTKAVRFHDLGMSFLDRTNFETFCAVGIAVLNKLLELTRIEGRFILDLCSPIPCWGDDDFKDGFRIKLRYLNETVQIYNEW